MLQNTNIKWSEVELWLSEQVSEAGLLAVYNKIDRMCWGPLDIEILDGLFDKNMERLNVANANPDL